jgi:hypothetical protein
MVVTSCDLEGGSRATVYRDRSPFGLLCHASVAAAPKNNGFKSNAICCILQRLGAWDRREVGSADGLTQIALGSDCTCA